MSATTPATSRVGRAARLGRDINGGDLLCEGTERVGRSRLGPIFEHRLGVAGRRRESNVAWNRRENTQAVTISDGIDDLGNAVPAQLSEALGRWMVSLLEQKKSETEDAA
jgi:hypothetical protein